ncbi:rRNA maturation RNase YbeY [Leptolyngbya sp. 7M]|uniref:rRNA maturation RNase YbeY n=1 Tax=Leptolyngbya sp. 7M TaxID=2812896 RepID=UPI001B8C28F3|nr:rRNA maturation RNase YbeY [Leptolyngbya sp. 7M]QYO67187.1 rRNA maturation RNase YbeY [Leptolyngbya sp. 7M]
MIINLQRKVKLNARAFAAFVDDVRAAVVETEGRTFSVAFISDRRMAELNKLFRGKDSTTDVLSFPHEADEFETHKENFLGDIVISAEQAKRQSEENKLGLETEIKQLILHGALHLCGYDHETDSGQMNARELELRDKLGIDV